MLNTIRVTGNKDTRSGFGDGIPEAAGRTPYCSPDSGSGGIF